MLRASTAPGSPHSNMLRYIYAISRFHRRVLGFSHSSRKWLSFGAFRVHQKTLLYQNISALLSIDLQLLTVYTFKVMSNQACKL